jgi:hypothetical protein
MRGVEGCGPEEGGVICKFCCSQERHRRIAGGHVQLELYFVLTRPYVCSIVCTLLREAS